MKVTRKRRISALLTAVILSVTMLPSTAFATDWEISKSKEATALDNNYESQVTLSLPAASYSGDLDVAFVLDGSTSHDNTNLAEAAATLLSELDEMKNLNVKASVTVFGGSTPILKTTDLLELTDNVNDLKDFLTTDYKSMSGRSGSNLQAGVEKARTILKADTSVSNSDKYMIILTDGGARMWYDSESGEAMSDAYQYGNSVWWNSNEDWCNRYGVTGKESYVSETAPSFESVWNEGKNGADIGAYGLTYSEHQAVLSGDTDITYATWDTAMHGTDYYTTYEAACYYAAKSIVAASAEVNVSMITYQYYSNTTYTTFTEEFKTWLESYVTRYDIAEQEDISEATAAEVFSAVKDELIQLLDTGSSVIDIIGYGTDDQGSEYDFDFVNDNGKLSLTVGGTSLTVTKMTDGLDSGETARYAFGSADENGVYPFVLHYYQNGTDESNGKECLIWEINTAVTKDAPVQLTYSVKLINPAEDVESHTGLYTNESAVLYPVDSDGNEEEPEEFERPDVAYGKHTKISEPGMDKTIVTASGSVDQDDVAAGDTVDFKLSSTIPEADLISHIDYTVDDNGNLVGTVKSSTVTDETSGTTTTTTDTYYLVFHDSMDSALTLDENSIKVSIDGTELDSKYYEVSKSNDGACTFEVSIELLQLYADNILDEADFGTASINVTYSATLSKDATAGSYLNTAWVTYNGTKSEEDTVEVDTYGVKIYKVDSTLASPSSASSSDASSRLDGATFKLYDNEGCEGDPVTTITTSTIDGEAGIAIVHGLDAGIYYLKEIDAPSGYVFSQSVVKIDIPTDVDANTNIAIVGIGNAPIPSTGGAGTRMYLIGGACLIVAAGTVFAVSRRKKED